MAVILNTIIIITGFLLSFKYGFSQEENILFLVSVLGSILYFSKNNSLKDNFFVFFFIAYILCSIHFVSLFEMTSTGFHKDVIFENEYKQLALWGNHLLFLILTSLGIVSLFQKNKRKHKKLVENQIFIKGNTSCDDSVIDKYIKYLTVFIFFLQLVSIKLGISSMANDVTQVVLPFHLNGFIDELRTDFYPFIFSIYIYDRLTKKKQLNKKLLLLFFLYAVFEMFVRSSKSAFLMSFLPVFVMMVFAGGISIKTLLRYVGPVFLIFLFLYPLVESVRSTGEQLSVGGLTKAFSEKKSNKDEGGSSTYIRTFLTGVYYTKIMDEIDSDQFSFDFRRIPLLIATGGGVGYMTQIVDEVPTTVSHSSGCTGLCDALLWGGNPMCYIIVLLLLTVALYGDKASLTRRIPPYRNILFFFFYSLITGSSISFFISPSLFPFVVGVLMKVIATKYYYKKIF